MRNRPKLIPITQLLIKIIDNRGKSVPTEKIGFPLIATNCIKHSSIYPTFEKIRYVSENTLNNWFRAHLEPNDILFVNKGTPGRVCLVPDPVSFCAAQDMMAFRVDEKKIYFKYLFAVLRSDWIQKKISNYHVGLVIPHFKKQDLSSILIPEKSEKDQKIIGDLYFNISNKIELNNKINIELETMAKLLYDYWFVQFDFPDVNGKPYKSSGGKMVYNDELKRKIPKGWEVKELCEIAEIIRGQLVTAKTADLNGQIKVVSGGIDFSYFHSKSNREKNTITVSGSGANAGYINFWREPIFANDCTTVRGKSDTETLYILEFLRLRQDYIFSQARGSAQPHVYPKDISSLKIVIPNNQLFEEYGKNTLSVNERIGINYQENHQLTELRDWLLPMLMNGQVTVVETQEALRMVAEAGVNYGA